MSVQNLGKTALDKDLLLRYSMPILASGVCVKLQEQSMHGTFGEK